MYDNFQTLDHRRRLNYDIPVRMRRILNLPDEATGRERAHTQRLTNNIVNQIDRGAEANRIFQLHLRQHPEDAQGIIAEMIRRYPAAPHRTRNRY